jgi:ribosomal protein L37AE/L43A
MIKRVDGEHVAECDDCGEEYAGGTLEFTAFVADLKKEGWCISKDGDTWVHTCPDCKDER